MQADEIPIAMKLLAYILLLLFTLVCGGLCWCLAVDKDVEEEEPCQWPDPCTCEGCDELSALWQDLGGEA